MSEAEARRALSEATERLADIENRSWDHAGPRGSHERALAINEAELSARTAKLRALEEIQQFEDSERVRYAIADTMSEIATNKRNIECYR